MAKSKKITPRKPSGILERAKALGKKIRTDNWTNTLTGLGVSGSDKVQSAEWVKKSVLTDSTLEGMYQEDPLAGRIVELIPQEAFKQGIGLDTKAELDPDAKIDAEELIMEALENLGAHEALMEAAIWGRLFGGGVVLLGVDDARQMAKPLDIEAVRDIRYLEVLDKRDMVYNTLYSDPRAPLFGRPETYRLNADVSGTVTNDTIIHESRLLIFGGAKTTRRERQRLSYWDHSVLHRVQDALKSYASDWGSVSNMLTDSSQAVLAVKGFYELVAEGQKDAFNTRLDLMSLSRWVGSITPIDAEETFSYIDRSFTGIPDLMDRSTMRLSAATGIPISILFGRAPSGLSGDAAGASDLQKWYNLVKSHQDHIYSPLYSKLIRIVAKAVDAPEPDQWQVAWPSLWQMTPEQEATVRKQIAETDQIYMNNQVVMEDEIRAQRFSSGVEHSLEQPQVELDAIPEFEPEPEPVAPPVMPPPPEEVAEETAEGEMAVDRADSNWMKAVPKEISDDLKSLKILAKTGAPQEILRRITTRLAFNLQLGTPDVLQSIAVAEIRWEKMAVRLDYAWPDAMTAPPYATDLIAYEVLVRVGAPKMMLDALITRIGRAMDLSESEVGLWLQGEQPVDEPAEEDPMLEDIEEPDPVEAFRNRGE